VDSIIPSPFKSQAQVAGTTGLIGKVDTYRGHAVVASAKNQLQAPGRCDRDVISNGLFIAASYVCNCEFDGIGPSSSIGYRTGYGRLIA
jgi:hypothetical protein